ncbi:hypothetical protein [Streptomyces sp. NPDC001500]
MTEGTLCMMTRVEDVVPDSNFYTAHYRDALSGRLWRVVVEAGVVRIAVAAGLMLFFGLLLAVNRVVRRRGDDARD